MQLMNESLLVAVPLPAPAPSTTRVGDEAADVTLKVAVTALLPLPFIVSVQTLPLVLVHPVQLSKVLPVLAVAVRVTVTGAPVE